MCDYTNPEVEPLGLQHTYLSLSGSREVPTKRHKKTTKKKARKKSTKKTEKKQQKKDKQIKNLLMIQQKEIDYLFLLIPPVCM